MNKLYFLIIGLLSFPYINCMDIYFAASNSPGETEEQLSLRDLTSDQFIFSRNNNELTMRVISHDQPPSSPYEPLTFENIDEEERAKITIGLVFSLSFIRNIIGMNIHEEEPEEVSNEQVIQLIQQEWDLIRNLQSTMLNILGSIREHLDAKNHSTRNSITGEPSRKRRRRSRNNQIINYPSIPPLYIFNPTNLEEKNREELTDLFKRLVKKREEKQKIMEQLKRQLQKINPPSITNKSDTCCICLEEKLMNIPCSNNHTEKFCLECYENTMNQSNGLCPLCREEL